MAYDIGPRISLKGESEFNKSIQNVNQQLKECGSEAKKVASSFEGQEKSVESLTKQNEVLQKQLDLQKQKLSLYQDQLAKLTTRQQEQKKAIEEATEKFGANSKEVEAAQKNYDATTTQISKLNVAINETETYCNRAKATIKENADAIEQMGDQYDGALKKISDAGGKVQDVGKKMSIVSAGVVGVGVAAQKAWSELDDAYDGIAAGTGATGQALDDLQASFDKVYGSFPADSADVGTAIADINTRLGLTGDALESATEKFLEYSKVNSTDVSSAIEGVAKAMADAGIPASELDTVLDKLTAASQASGLSTDELTEALSKNGVNMRQLGFNLDQTIALLTTFEKKGVDSSTVITGMRAAVKNYAKDGKNASVEIQKMFDAIADGSATAADAQEVFGTKAGAAVYEYAREGKLNVSDMMQVLAGSADQLGKSYDAMLDPADEATTAMNNLKLVGADLSSTIQGALAPVLKALVVLLQDFTNWFKGIPQPMKEMIVIIGGIVAAIGPLLVVVGTVMQKAMAIKTFITTFGPAFTKMGGLVKTVLSGIGTGVKALFTLIAAHPVIAIITAIIAIIVVLYNKCEWFRDGVNAVFEAIGNVCSEIFGSMVEWFTVTMPSSLDQLGQQFSQIGQNIQKGWLDMCNNIDKAIFDFAAGCQEAGTNVLNFFSGIWQGLKNTIIQPFTDGFNSCLRGFSDFLISIKNWCSKIVSNIGSTLGNLGRDALTWGRDMIQGFMDGIGQMVGRLIDKVKGIAGSIASFLHFSVPDKGPLSDFDESGGDMMDLLIGGIESKKRQLADTIKGVAESMQMNNSVMVGGNGTMMVEMPIYLDGRMIQRSVNSVSVSRAQAASLAKGG